MAMTTSKVFGIVRPGDHIAQPQEVQPQVSVSSNTDEQLKLEQNKTKLLQEAVEKFLDKKITKAELEAVQKSLQ